MAHPLNKKEAQRRIKAVEDALRAGYKPPSAGGGAVQAAAEALGISGSVLRNSLPAIKERYGLAPDWSIWKAPAAGATQVRAAQDREDLRKRLKEAHQEIIALEDKLAAQNAADSTQAQPSQWTLDTRQPKGKSPHIPLLFFSDAQAGEVIDPEETDTAWAYNSAIFRKRYRNMIATTIDLALTHGGTRWSYPGIVYARGGDNISGGLHEDLRELGEDCTAIQQCELVFEEEAAGILKLAEAFGKVEVLTPGASGNHDRSTHKPPTKRAYARSFDYLIHRMLVAQLGKDKRIIFRTTKSFDIRFNIFDKQLLCTHGDRIGSKGGAGFVGPAMPIIRGWQKVHAEQARLGFPIDLVLTGHFHYPLVIPDLGIGNGSFTGTSEFGKSFRMQPTPPTQILTFWHHKHGCVDVRPLFLETVI